MPLSAPSRNSPVDRAEDSRIDDVYARGTIDVAARVLSASPLPVSRAVLVVEDDPDARHLLELMLARRGHDVIGVGTAELGLDMLRRRTFDVVLTDENLPLMSGTRMLHEAFSEGLLVPERALVCTADPFVRPGAGVRVMTKPLDIARIAQFVEGRAPTRSEDIFDLVLYITGDSAPSIRARRNLERFIARNAVRARVYVRDLAIDPTAGDSLGLARTPVLVRTRPTPRVKLVGDLRDEAAVSELFASDPFVTPG